MGNEIKVNKVANLSDKEKKKQIKKLEKEIKRLKKRGGSQEEIYELEDELDKLKG